MRPITHLVVHCSATPADRDVTAKEIDRWHRQRGWRCIGYHYVIRRDGTVETGRPLEQPGAHVEGHNANTIGICMAGGMTADMKKAENNFTPPQFAALHRLLMELKARFPQADICGHRDFPKVAKDCPSFDVRAWLRNYPAPSL